MKNKNMKRYIKMLENYYSYYDDLFGERHEIEALDNELVQITRVELDENYLRKCERLDERNYY